MKKQRSRKHNKLYTGINIQFPISQSILSGEKTVETRTYPIPAHYLNEEMLLVETPGKLKKFKSRLIGIIKFTKCFSYTSEIEFYKDTNRHLVTPDSPWRWQDKPKYGWEVELITRFKTPIELKGVKKGIVYTRNIKRPYQT